LFLNITHYASIMLDTGLSVWWYKQHDVWEGNCLIRFTSRLIMKAYYFTIIKFNLPQFILLFKSPIFPYNIFCWTIQYEYTAIQLLIVQNMYVNKQIITMHITMICVCRCIWKEYEKMICPFLMITCELTLQNLVTFRKSVCDTF